MVTFNSNEDVVPEKFSPPDNLDWSDNSMCGREGSAGRETEDLREAMEKQKRSISVTSDNINKLQAKPGYNPLSEGKFVYNIVLFINCLWSELWSWQDFFLWL